MISIVTAILFIFELDLAVSKKFIAIPSENFMIAVCGISPIPAGPLAVQQLRGKSPIFVEKLTFEFRFPLNFGK